MPNQQIMHWIFSFITKSFKQVAPLLLDKIEDNKKSCQKTGGHNSQYQKEKLTITRQSACAGSQSVGLVHEDELLAEAEPPAVCALSYSEKCINCVSHTLQYFSYSGATRFPNWQFSFSAFAQLATRVQGQVACQQILIDTSTSPDKILASETIFLSNMSHTATIWKGLMILYSNFVFL